MPAGWHSHECLCCHLELGTVCADYACSWPRIEDHGVVVHNVQPLDQVFVPLCYACWTGLMGEDWREPCAHR